MYQRKNERGRSFSAVEIVELLAADMRDHAKALTLDEEERLAADLEQVGFSRGAYASSIASILEGKVAVTPEVARVLCDHMLDFAGQEREDFLFVCGEGLELAQRDRFPVIILNRNTRTAQKAAFVSSEERNRQVERLVRDGYAAGDNFGMFVRRLIEAYGIGSEHVAHNITSRLRQTDGFDGKAAITGGYLRNMATDRAHARPKGIVIDMFARAYRLSEPAELMLHKMARGEDIDIPQAIKAAEESGDTGALVKALLAYSGLGETAVERLTGLHHSTLSGWCNDNMTPGSREQAESFLRLTYHPELLRAEREKRVYKSLFERMRDVLIDRPLRTPFCDLVDEAERQPDPQVALMDSLLGKRGKLDLDEDGQKKLLGVNRDTLYKLREGKMRMTDESADRLLKRMRCTDEAIGARVKAILVGIPLEGPKAWMQEVREGVRDVRALLREAMRTKGHSITDAERITGTSRIGPYLNGGRIGIPRHARNVAAYCGMTGDKARELAARILHENEPTYSPAEILANADQSPETRKEARKALVRLSAMDSHELSAAACVPHWVVNDWANSGRANQFGPVLPAFVTALGLGEGQDDDAKRAIGEDLLEKLGARDTVKMRINTAAPSGSPARSA